MILFKSFKWNKNIKIWSINLFGSNGHNSIELKDEILAVIKTNPNLRMT